MSVVDGNSAVLQAKIASAIAEVLSRAVDEGVATMKKPSVNANSGRTAGGASRSSSVLSHSPSVSLSIRALRTS